MRTSEWLAVACAAVALTAVLTWPLVARFGTAGRVDSGDGRYSIWNVAWVAHAMTSPASLYDANIFYPHSNTLAFSEANLVAGALALPVWRLTGNPLAASNWVVFLAFVLSAITTYALVRRLTGSVTGATVSATAFAYGPYTFAHLPHVQLLMTFGLPAVLLALHAFVDRPNLARTTALGVAMALASLACGYYGVFAGLLAGFGVAWFGAFAGRGRRLAYWMLAAGAALLAALIAWPFFAPYLEIRTAGFGRSLGDARLFSADWRAYLASPRALERWMLPLIGHWREVAFPGFLTLALALVAGASSLRRRGGHLPAGTASIVGFYAALALLSIWASFGPDAGLYAVLHQTIPLFALLRAPARFGVLVTLCLAVLAGFGARALLSRTGRRAAPWVSGTLVAGALASAVVGPLWLVDGPSVNPVYRRLAVVPRAPTIELPFWQARHEVHRHTEYMLMSTYHWQPLVNGYSDYTPPEAVERTARLAAFPDPQAWSVISELRARYLVVHWDLFDADSARRVHQAVSADSRLRLMIETPQMNLYEVVQWQ